MFLSKCTIKITYISNSIFNLIFLSENLLTLAGLNVQPNLNQLSIFVGTKLYMQTVTLLKMESSS